MLTFAFSIRKTQIFWRNHPEKKNVTFFKLSMENLKLTIIIIKPGWNVPSSLKASGGFSCTKLKCSWHSYVSMENFSFDMNGIVWPRNQIFTGKSLTISCVAIHTLFFLLSFVFQSWSVSPLLKKALPARKRSRDNIFAAVVLIAVCTLCFWTSTLSPVRPCRMQFFRAATASFTAGLVRWGRTKSQTPS